MLLTKNLSFSYNSKVKFNFPDINCQSGEALLVLGNSGCGKSTLLHLLGGMLKPQNGEIWIDNTNIAQMNNRELDQFRGQHIGIVFQKSHFIQSLTVLENATMAQHLAGKKVDKASAEKLLSQLGLSDRLHTNPSQLSQGEQQRLSIVRAIINQPKLILADEPTSALDDKNCEEVIGLLQTHSSQVNANLIIVTHDIRLKNIFPNQINMTQI